MKNSTTVAESDNYDWGWLTPERVSQWINFKGDDSSWQYAADNRESMAAKQIEGVAYLWNKLSVEGTALLADEVGMGKTFQALGVAALLWRMKPDARILIMAPNRNICRHWLREFNTFVARHYRAKDHAVRNLVNGEPVPAVKLCFKLNELADAVDQRATHLFVTTISSLSGLVPADRKQESNKDKIAQKAAEQVNERIRHALNDEGFDLVIVDEAHYLRNVGGGSQLVAAARSFFGSEGSRIGKHNLLLTATPSHTRLSNVESILSYFTDMSLVNPTASKSDADVAMELLKRFALRRLRLMEGQGSLHSKLNYRHEKPIPCGFEGRPNAELFFALYQKRLVSELQKKTENRSLLYGYLEGFESTGPRPEGAVDGVTHDDEDGREGTKDDFSKAQDTDLLQALTADYFNAVGDFPDHPKYGSIVEKCLPKDLYAAETPLIENKHLVFVRRIPSVRELTQRLNASYDQMLARLIVSAWGLTSDDARVSEWKRSGWSRDAFELLIASLSDQDASLNEVIEIPEGEIEEESEKLASHIAELFVIKKGKGGQTDCANVRLRFVKPESIFSLFLEPSRDYLVEGYSHYYNDIDKNRFDYANAALYERFEKWGSVAVKREAVGKRSSPTEAYGNELITVWALVVPLLNDRLKLKLQGWARNERSIAENFANYLKAGLLYASPVIVEIYSWFVVFRREYPGRQDAQERYIKFIKWVEPRIPTSLLFRYFNSALESFDLLCGKIIDHGLHEWQREWRSLKSLTSPAWYASGENRDGRERLILGFNTPFYPNVLVSTSVLQEGVNLHMQCYQVHHYGLAGSPGDNEQRVGRVDRLFGCVNQRLQTGKDTDLEIFYPYLEQSVDEDQVASFIERKHGVEERMDACLQANFDNKVTLSATNDWMCFLRKPSKVGQGTVVDPYPAKFENITSLEDYRSYPYSEAEPIRKRLEDLVRGIIDPTRESVQAVDDSAYSSGLLFLIDPVVDHEGVRRNQPIFVHLSFSSSLSALVPETAYLVSFVSPIGNKASFDSFRSTDAEALQQLECCVSSLYSAFPLARLTINSQAENSYFYLSAQVDLPLFVKEGGLEMLSSQEMKMAFEDIKKFSDEIELLIHGGNQDLALEDVSNVQGKSKLSWSSEELSSASSGQEYRWSLGGGVHGSSEYLSCALSLFKIGKYLGKEVHNSDRLELFPALLELNSRFPLARFERVGDCVRLVLAYPQVDIQKEERGFLEKWFLYLRSQFA